MINIGLGLGERTRGQRPRTGIGSKSSWIVGLEVEGGVGDEIQGFEGCHLLIHVGN